MRASALFLIFQSLIFSLSLIDSKNSHAAEPWKFHMDTPGSPPLTEPLRNYVGREGIRRIDLGEAVADLLFDVIDDRELFEFEVENAEFDAEIDRKVYETIPGTDHWTVVDEFRLNGEIPLLGNNIDFDDKDFSISDGVGFHLGLRGRMVFQNIRQVAPKNYTQLPSPEDRRRQIEETGLLQMLNGQGTAPASGGIWVSGYESSPNLMQSSSTNKSDKETFFTWPWDDNTENRARFGRLLNLLFHPFRIPFKAERINRLDDGEIISYLTRGSVEFGPSVGWSADLGAMVGSATVTASVGVYLAGQYQISILKENDRYVRVKAARLGQAGMSGSAQARIKTDVLDGIILVEKLDDLLEIVPFKFNTTKVIGRQFAVTYRYDLQNPHAAEAFEKAVMGRMRMSDQLAHDENGQPSNPAISGVEKLETRRTDSKSGGRSRSLELSILVNRDGRINRNDITTVITTANGTRHLFESNVSAKTKNSVLWMNEKMQFDYVINLDRDKYERNANDPLALQMIIQGKIEDRRTKRDEMMSYILMAEDTTGKLGVFPRPPHRDSQNLMTAALPADEVPDGVKFDSFNSLGRSRIEFEINLDNQQLNEIINTAEQDMWRHLESGFNVEENSWSSSASRGSWRLQNAGLWLLNLPLFIADVHLRNGEILQQAEQVHRLWNQVKQASTGKARAEGLAKLFYDRIYHYDIVRMVRSVLSNQNVYFYAGAYTELFGRINCEGNSRLKSGDFASETQKRIDRVRREEGIDQTADVSNLRIQKISAQQWMLSFDLNVEPNGLYVQLQNDKRWFDVFKTKRVKDALAYNLGQFQQGYNEIIMDAADKNSLYSEIAEAIESGERYIIKASVNPDGLGFGPKAAFAFRAP